MLKETISLADQLYKLIKPKKDYIQLYEEERILNIIKNNIKNNNEPILDLISLDESLRIVIHFNEKTDKLLLWFNNFEPLQLNNLNKLLSIKYWKILE